MAADMDSDAVRSRLEALCPILDQIQDNTRSASISTGVLHHGEVVLTRSRGFRDAESQAPVDSETNYPICSLTKAFTAACCGILVDEGKLEWAKPLQSYIPFRSTADPVIGERATMQDALSHNTGLAHMDLTWLGLECDYILDKEDLLGVVNHLPPVHDLRSGFHYNNYMYAVAGLVIEQQPGRPWYEFLKERILEPLAMHRTVTNRAKLPDDNVAEPHVVLDDYSLHRQKAVDTAADNTLMGPAGPDWSAQAIAQTMFGLQPPIDFAEVSKQRAKVEYERYADLAADFEYFQNKERGEEKHFNVNLEDYVGKYVNTGLKMALDIRHSSDKSLIMVVNNVPSQHHRLTHFAGDKLGFLPSSREEFVIREFIDWFKWDQFVLCFHRHEEWGMINGVAWALQNGIKPVYFKRISLEE
ncbi:hypothetical protein FANTH_1382 [Fusarium anthophilum]|uniref:Beta-lactamase-related domain-containing protein n=1 Tax=Fusarium anthophilum TaxID=48485 RepID=A0A8H4ZWA6_9HYPO|nr:hypothetical protein FANTH_1382 [Fusarium anthophilum]